MNRQQDDLTGDFAYEALPSLPEGDLGSPDLLSSESYEWGAPANLDDFFYRIYRYYEEKGFAVICVSRMLNLLALGFTIIFSAFLLLFVKWSAFKSDCIREDTCDISKVALDFHPWREGATVWNVLCGMYLVIFTAYWLYNLAHLFFDLRAAADIRHFTTHNLGLSERQLQTVTWPEVATRIVQAQKTTRLCIVRDLTEHDIVSRIMRKENFLIGMLNQGVLALHIALPGMRPRFMLTKTLEWNLHWCILDSMFDDAFRIRPEFVNNSKALERRFRRMAIANLALAPFLLIFLLIYFFLRNAEKFYHSPSSLGARRWSPLASWRLREFNELPYYVQHRLNASHKAAERYIAQFPSPMLSSVAKFVAFIAGSFAALLLFLALMNDTLLERHLYGRNLVWWAATLGIVLAASRAFIVETGTAFEPELALLETVAHTHYLPRHWRGRAHTREVQTQFQQLFQFKALLFLEEMASILLTPFILYFSLPKCAPAIVRFVGDFSLHVDGLGDVCSLATSFLERHGNFKYGSPYQAPKGQRSRQGKMEKSLISFMATYPTWQPDAAAKQLLLSLSTYQPLQQTPHFPYTANAEHLVAAGLGGIGNSVVVNGAQQRNGASLFASAEMPRWHAASIVPASAHPLSESEWRVASSQKLMQSFYEDRDRAMRHGMLQPPRSPEGPITAARDLSGSRPGNGSWALDNLQAREVAVPMPSQRTSVHWAAKAPPVSCREQEDLSGQAAAVEHAHGLLEQAHTNPFASRLPSWQSNGNGSEQAMLQEAGRAELDDAEGSSDAVEGLFDPLNAQRLARPNPPGLDAGAAGLSKSGDARLDDGRGLSK